MGLASVAAGSWYGVCGGRAASSGETRYTPLHSGEPAPSTCWDMQTNGNKETTGGATHLPSPRWVASCEGYGLFSRIRYRARDVLLKLHRMTTFALASLGLNFRSPDRP